jgi:rhamnosyltransferase
VNELDDSATKLVRSRICAVIVLFHPDTGFTDRLSLILKQFPKVVLIDNTPSGAVLGELPASVRVLRNHRNLGVAAALNQGIALAIEAGCDWVATFDQDSELLPGYLDAMISVVERNVPAPVLVGSNHMDTDSGRLAHAVPKEVCPRPTLITSGTFMPARFATAIGGFREDYFIDSVDHEFCLRAARNGAKVLVTAQPFLRHRMGFAAIGVGRPFSLQHSHSRRYYIARNTMLTIRGHGLRHPAWALRQFARLIAEGTAIVAFESEKASKLRAFSLGLWHGMIGRSGVHEPAE